MLQEEDEWKEIEEERRDYTGLKIGQLTINEDDQDQDGYADGEQTEGETGTSNIKGQDPWKKSGSTGVQLTNVGNLTSTPATNLDSASQVYVSPAVKVRFYFDFKVYRFHIYSFSVWCKITWKRYCS